MKGFNDLEKQMKNIINKVEDEIDGSVSFEELFNLGFIDKNSDFETFEELLNHFGFKVHNQEEFEALDEEKLDEAIRKSSCFDSWKEMYKAATKEYVFRKLKNAGFDVENK